MSMDKWLNEKNNRDKKKIEEKFKNLPAEKIQELKKKMKN